MFQEPESEGGEGVRCQRDGTGGPCGREGWGREDDEIGAKEPALEEKDLRASSARTNPGNLSGNLVPQKSPQINASYKLRP